MEGGAAVYSALAESTLFFRPCASEDIPVVAEIEGNSYPADEAASPENLAYRQANAGDFFIVGIQTGTSPTEAGGDELVSYVCGTLTTADVLTHESMSTHEPEGKTLCIHSVVTEGGHRRKQIGTRTLRAYMQWVVNNTPEVEKVLLLCKKHLIGFYEGAGFRVVGPSAVEHGADQWYEMAQKTAFARAVGTMRDDD